MGRGRLANAVARGAAHRGVPSPQVESGDCIDEPSQAKRAPRPTYFAQHSTFVRAWHRVLRVKSAATVWHYLFDIAHRDGRFLFVGRDRIAAETGVSTSSVKRALRELESRGAVEVERPGTYYRGAATGYRIPDPMPLPPQ